jgi:hypothetical protein
MGNDRYIDGTGCHPGYRCPQRPTSQKDAGKIYVAKSMMASPPILLTTAGSDV